MCPKSTLPQTQGTKQNTFLPFRSHPPSLSDREAHHQLQGEDQAAASRRRRREESAICIRRVFLPLNDRPPGSQGFLFGVANFLSGKKTPLISVRPQNRTPVRFPAASKLDSQKTGYPPKKESHPRNAQDVHLQRKLLSPKDRDQRLSPMVFEGCPPTLLGVSDTGERIEDTPP